MKNTRLVLINEKILGYVDTIVSSDKISLRLNQAQVRAMNPYLPIGGVHCHPFGVTIATGTLNDYQIEDKSTVVLDTAGERWKRFRDDIDPFGNGRELVWLDFYRSSINEMGDDIDTGSELLRSRSFKW